MLFSKKAVTKCNLDTHFLKRKISSKIFMVNVTDYLSITTLLKCYFKPNSAIMFAFVLSQPINPMKDTAMKAFEMASFAIHWS